MGCVETEHHAHSQLFVRTAKSGNCEEAKQFFIVEILDTVVRPKVSLLTMVITHIEFFFFKEDLMYVKKDLHLMKAV